MEQRFCGGNVHVFLLSTQQIVFNFGIIYLKRFIKQLFMYPNSHLNKYQAYKKNPAVKRISRQEIRRKIVSLFFREYVGWCSNPL